MTEQKQNENLSYGEAIKQGLKDGLEKSAKVGSATGGLLYGLEKLGEYFLSDTKPAGPNDVPKAKSDKPNQR